MFGCMKRIGCLVLIVVIAALAWLTRDRWYPGARPVAGDDSARGGAVVWEPLTPEGAERARVAVASLSPRSGQSFANTKPGDLAAYVFTGISKQLPPSAEDVRAAAIDDQLHVRALVKLADFGGAKVLGPLAGFLSERDTVEFGGNFEVVRPGLAQFRVRQIKLRQLSLPNGAIPKLIAQIRRGALPPGIAPDALPLEVPTYIGDVRVGQGKVTLYKGGL